jgi:DNA-binding IclR family transcriptional regulator
MRRELDSARERGYAVQRGELRDDVAALASPIVGDDGRPVAAVGLFIPVQRLAGEDEESLGKLVAEAASEISAGLTAWRTSTRR